MAEVLNEDDQIFRLICCGVGLLGTMSAEGNASTSGGRSVQVERGLERGIAIFEEVKAQGLWPIIPDPPEEP